MRFRPTRVLAITFVFLLTGLIGVWAAYDRQVGWQRFGLITGGLVISLAVAWVGQQRGERTLGAIGLGCAVLAAALAAHFMLTHNWTTGRPVKFPVLQEAGLWVQTRRPGLFIPTDINPNLIAGGLALLMPLGIAGVVWTWMCRHWPGVLLGASALILALAAFILSSSRGAWLGLSAGMLTATYLEWRTEQVSWAALRRWGDGVLWGTWLVALAGFGAILVGPGIGHWLDTLPIDASAIARAKLWRDSLVLIGDYPFTGSGLGSTVMVYSSYVLLLHVGFIDQHVHNLLLQVAVEQGLPGLLAFLGLLGTVIWELAGSYHRHSSASILRWASTAALIAFLVQGVGEAGNYNSPMVLIGFLPLGFALGSAQRREVNDQHDVSSGCLLGAQWAPFLGRLSVILGVLILSLPGLRAAFQANLGAVAQTRAELSIFHWPEWPIQDAVRRSPQVNLGPAIAHYQAALALAPTNATANRRLGQIELSLGEYNSARRHLEAAYGAAPDQRATRQLLGESYAVIGEVERAAVLWRTVDVSQNQLALRQLWYTHMEESQQVGWLAEAVARSTTE